VPEEVKRRRNNELLDLQNEICAKVHQSWVGRTVEVFVEQVREKPAPRPQPGHPLAPSPGTTLTINGASRLPSPARSELGTRNSELPTLQASGRTPGDLIVAFDVPSPAESNQQSTPSSLVGRIVPVRITGASTLMLRGEAMGKGMGNWQ